MVYFRWFTACVSDCDTLECIVVWQNWDALFWAMIFVDLCGMFWALKILCFSLWNSLVTPGREPVERRTGVWSWGIQAKCIAEMTRVTRFVTRIWDQSMVLLGFSDSSRNYGGPCWFWEDKRCIRIVPWCTHVKIADRSKIVKQI